ncbi:MAG: hypothetical protein M1828_005141 [Chrysothrix sp. TS-e1954]|nr:MAG: hypothetical protein M1828_005141 [Chrysothrix sp. TS-e1954]
MSDYKRPNMLSTYPSYGARPLATFFLFLRGLQVVAFIIILGLTSYFVSEIVSAQASVASEIVATLAIACVATLYTCVSIVFFYARANKTLLLLAGLDLLSLVAFVVVAVTLGRPISYLNCFALDNATSSADMANAATYAASLKNNIGMNGNLVGWAGATKASCFETKGVWGLSIALCVLFTCTTLVLPTLFAKNRRGKSRRGDPQHNAGGNAYARNNVEYDDEDVRL